MLPTGEWMLSGVWLQDAGSISSGNSRLLMIFVGLVALAMLIQAFVVLALAIVGIKTQKRLMGIVEELKVKAMPIIASTQSIVQDAVPKAKVITENFVEVSHVVRTKVQEFEATLADVNTTIKDTNQKTHAQVNRVDSMVSTMLTRTAAIGDSIHHSIRTPVKQVAGVVTGFKVGLEQLLSGGKGPTYRGPNA